MKRRNALYVDVCDTSTRIEARIAPIGVTVQTHALNPVQQLKHFNYNQDKYRYWLYIYPITILVQYS